MGNHLGYTPMPTLVGDSFSIRPYQFGDAASLQLALNDPLVYERLTNVPRPYTMSHAEAWVSNSVSIVTPETKRVNFVIIKEGEVAGSVAFINLNMAQNNAQISVWIAQRFWGQGLAARALALLLEFGFTKLDLHRVSAFHVADNVKSGRTLKKLGFRLEGIHKEEWKKQVGDSWQRFDSLHYALLKHEWETRKEMK